MKHIKIISVLILFSLLVSSCSVSDKGNTDMIELITSRGIPADTSEVVFVAREYLSNNEDTDIVLIDDRELIIDAQVSDKYRDELPEINLYIMSDYDEGTPDPDMAEAFTTGEYDTDNDQLTFRLDLPACMDSGSYTYVFTFEDGTVDSVFERQIVFGYRDSSNVVHPPRPGSGSPVMKPVIYLYPEEETDVTVNIDLNGEFTCTYPEYDDQTGWSVTASPDGNLISNGREYDYLFWEGNCDVPSDFEYAVCVRGEDTREFLESYLETAGLNYSEIDDFISFWLPKMESNNYNLISFPMDEYEQMAELSVSPAPDTVIRVYMVFTPLEDDVYIPEEQQLILPETPDRSGFTVVEWGGSEI